MPGRSSYKQASRSTLSAYIILIKLIYPRPSNLQYGAIYPWNLKLLFETALFKPNLSVYRKLDRKIITSQRSRLSNVGIHYTLQTANRKAHRTSQNPGSPTISGCERLHQARFPFSATNPPIIRTTGCSSCYVGDSTGYGAGGNEEGTNLLEKPLQLQLGCRTIRKGKPSQYKVENSK